MSTTSSGPESRPARVRFLLAVASSSLVGFLLYLPTASHGWVFDDHYAVAGQPLAQDPADVEGIVLSPYWAGVLPRANLYRPVTVWSFALNHAITGPGPAGHHATNAALHGLIAGLIVILARAWGLGAVAAAVAGLLFATHPMHVEAVAPVVGRADLLAVGLMLSAWILHLKVNPLRSEASLTAQPSRGILIGASVALYAAAVLSKENAAVLPALVLATGIAIAPRPIAWLRLTATPLLMLAALAGVIALRAAVLPDPDPADARIFAFAHQSVTTRLFTAVAVLGRYLFLTLLPVTPTADYGFDQIPFVTTPMDVLFIVSLIAHLALAAGGFVLARRGGVAGAAILLYLGALFPVSNLAFSTGTILGERLLLLPTAGACLIAAAAVERARGAARTAFLVTAGIAVALMGAWAVSRSADWRDDLTLFRKMSASSPRSARVWYGLGVQEAAAGDIRAAIDAYRRALAVRPAYPECDHNLGLLLLRQGSLEEAIAALRRASRMDPALPDVLNDLGVALERAGRWAEAETAYRAQLDREPARWRAGTNLGQILLTMGRPAEAVEPLQRSLAANPGNGRGHGLLVIALTLTGRHDDASRAIDEAIRGSEEFAKGLIPFARTALSLKLPRLAATVVSRARALGEPIPDDVAAGVAPR